MSEQQDRSAGTFSLERWWLGLLALTVLAGGALLAVGAGSDSSIGEFCANIVSGNFMPHGHCYFWQDELVWLHAASDSLIAISYFSIPFGLVVFASRRKEASFRNLFLLFGSFICLCGLTHSLGVYNIWNGAYWLSGFAKAATAFVSVVTAVVLLKSLPKALTIPLPNEYKRVQSELSQEKRKRLSTERKLQVRVDELSGELWDSDSRWRRLSEYTHPATWLTDENGAVVQPMPSWQQFTGQSREEYSGYGWLRAFYEGDREAIRTEWDRCVDAGCDYEIEARLWKDSEARYAPVVSKGIPIKGQDGEVLEWIGSIQDLSKQKAQEESLEKFSNLLVEQNSYLREFARLASHDLREPLRKISFYGRVLVEDHGESLNEDARKCIEIMDNASVRMGDLLEDLMRYSQVSTSDLDITKIDLGSLVKQAEEDLEISIREAGAEIRAGELGEIEADAGFIGHVFMNLIGNAIKYRSPDRKSVVEVSAKRIPIAQAKAKLPAYKGSVCCEIAIKDNGIGFEQKYAERIVKPFQRLHGKGSFEGSGMGLAICQRIIERHEGSLHIQSTLGEGSIFTVYLPYAESNHFQI